jgi:hypothetical protein
VLIAQSNCVVLFDEIDSFLLDRESLRYSKQETVFQFITPGMLTKLNDLRRAKRVLFVIGTNYEHRIDPAIKRTGRVDKHYLVLPMDADARERTLRKLLLEEKKFTEKEIGIIDSWPTLRDKSLYLSYNDMKGAVLEMKKNAKNIGPELETELDKRKPTTSIKNYDILRTRGDDKDLDSAKPWKEFFCMMGLALETDAGLARPEWRPVLKISAKELAREAGTVPLAEAVKDRAPGLDDDFRSRIADEFEKRATRKRKSNAPSKAKKTAKRK